MILNELFVCLPLFRTILAYHLPLFHRFFGGVCHFSTLFWARRATFPHFLGRGLPLFRRMGAWRRGDKGAWEEKVLAIVGERCYLNWNNRLSSFYFGDLNVL